MPQKSELYMQAYRSGHNEAVLKTVRPKATGVRIPQPAPKAPSNVDGAFFFEGNKDRRDVTAVTMGEQDKTIGCCFVDAMEIKQGVEEASL